MQTEDDKEDADYQAEGHRQACGRQADVKLNPKKITHFLQPHNFKLVSLFTELFGGKILKVSIDANIGKTFIEDKDSFKIVSISLPKYTMATLVFYYYEKDFLWK